NPLSPALADDHSELPQHADAIKHDQIPVGFVQALEAPLSAIKSAGYVLEDAVLADENHREVAEIILNECHRLDGLVRALEANQAALPAYREVDLSSILDEIVRRGRPLAEAAQINLRKEDSFGGRMVCDSELVEQAALNLIAHAIGAIEHGDEIIVS